MLAFGVALAAVAVRLVLDPVLEDRVPYLVPIAAMFVLVVIVRPAPFLAGAAVAWLATWFLFVPPRYTFSVAGVTERTQLVTAAIVFLVAGFTTWLSHRAQARTLYSLLRADQNREALRVTLASIGDAVITTDTAGRITSMNAAAQQVSGWRADEALGRPLDDVFRIVDEATRLPAPSPASKVLATGQNIVLANHTILLRKDGTEVHIDDSAAPIKDATGRVFGVVLTFRDITQRRAAERAIARSESDLSDFFEHAGIGLQWVDTRGIIIRANRAKLEMLGYSRDEYLFRPISDFHVDRGVAADIVERLARAEILRDVPARLRCKDGTTRDVLINSSPFFEDGRLVHSRCFSSDVTQQREAQRVLAETRDRVAAQRDALQLAMSGAQLEAVLAVAARAAQSLCRSDNSCAAAILLVDSSEDRLKLAAGAGLPGALVERAQSVPRVGPPSITAQAARERDAVVWRELREQNIPPDDRRLIDEERICSYWSFPIRAAESGGEILGALDVYHHTTCAPRAHQLESIEVMTSTIALILSRHRSLETTAASREQIATLNAQLSSRVHELQTLLNVIPIGVFVAHDPECKVITANRAGDALLAVPEGSNVSKSAPALDLPFRVLRNGEDVPPDDLPLQRSARLGITIEGEELDVVRADGSVITLHELAAPLFDDHGRVRGSIGAFVDITERKRAEVALRESESRFRLMANASPVLMWITGTDKLATWFNKTWLEFVGRTLEQDVGLGWLESVHPDDVQQAKQIYFSGFDRREPIAIEYRLRRRDGVYRWILDHGSPRYDNDHNFVGYIGSCVDITDRKEAEAALVRSEALFRRMADANLIGVGFGDLEGNVTYINDEMLRMMGRTRAEFDAGRINFLKSMSPPPSPSLPAVAEPLADELRAKGVINRYERVFVKPDGERTFYLGAAALVDPATGLHVSIALDVTDRKRADEQRDILLASERAAREQSERAGRLKDEFLATLSHELRTPLNAILGWTYILQRGSNAPNALEQGLVVIERNARIQSQLITDLLDMSRIISGKMRLEVQRVELPGVIQAAVDSIRPAANAKGIVIQPVLESITDPIHGDPARLQQIVWNLVSNAVKFTPRGGKVQVVLARVNSHVEIAVSDTGKGISPAFLPHVFERFRQADSSPAREQGGLGLGLAIVKQLVELHGGSVRAKSNGEGRGSTFTVELPLAMAHRDQTEPVGVHPKAHPLAPVKIERPNLEGIRVLVVEDEPDGRDLVRRVLEECRASVIVASNADEGLIATERELPDVILSDIGLPGRDGYAFMRELRQRGVMTPAIALTAFARSEDRTRALYAGYQTHIAKPVEPAELLATVASMARKQSPPSPLSQGSS